MARNNPVISWIIRQRPSKDPKFHQAEMLGGVGRSISVWLIIFSSGCVLRRGVISFCS